MIIQRADAYDYVRVAHELTLSAPTDYWLATCDTVFDMLRSCLVDVGLVPAEQMLRDKPAAFCRQQLNDLYFVHAPTSNRYSWIEDEFRYGSRLNGLNTFLSVLGLVSKSSFVPGSEHDVRHAKCDAVAANFDAETWISPSWSGSGQLSYSGWYTKLVNLFVTNCPTYNLRKTAAIGRNSYEAVGDNYYGYTPARFWDIVDDISNHAPSGQTWTRPWNMVYSTVSMSDFEVSSTTDYRYVEFRYRVKWNLSNSLVDLWSNPGWYWLMQNKLVLARDDLVDLPRSLMELNSVRAIKACSVLKWDFTSTCLEAGGYNAPWTYQGGYLLETPYNNSNIPDVGHVDHSSGVCESTRLISYVANQSNLRANYGITALRRDDPFGRFYGAVLGALGDLRASAFISCSDAFDEAIKSVDNNFLEDLSQLPHFLEILPDLQVLMKLLKSIKSDVGSVFEVLQWLASERLRLSFDTLPNVNLIIEVIPRMLELMRHLSSLSHDPIKGYGQYTFEFPSGSFGRDSSFLVVRSKAVLNSYPDGPLATVLGLDALGLLPSVSNLWNLVPFSFVVDWAFKVTDRLKDAENFALMAMLGFKVLVHSYTVYTPVTQQEMDSYGITLEDPAGTVLKVYIREVSSHMPFPRNSRWDFRVPSRPPNWMVAGSLFLTQV